MNKLIVFLGLSIALVGCKSNQETATTETKAPYKVTSPGGVVTYPRLYPKQDYIENLVNMIASDARGGRDTGSPGLADVAYRIENIWELSDRIEEYDGSYFDNFDVDGVKAFNMVGVLPGKDEKLKDEYVIIGAHYDHIGEGKPVGNDKIANGANDNAAGTAAVIALSRYMASTRTNKRSVLFVAFSAEERGLLGSKHLAAKLKQDGINVVSMINFEMIGVPMQRKYSAYLTGYDTSSMAAKFNEYTGKNTLGKLAKAEEFRLFMRSDNFPFYEQMSIPAQTISTFDFENYEYYHDVRDEPDQLDYKFMTELIHELIPGVVGIINAPATDIVLND